MPQVKKSLRLNTEAAVKRDVQNRFRDRLPPQWEALIYFGCFPQILEDPDVLGFEDMKPAVDAFHRCLGLDFDLALQILSYARLRCAHYDPVKSSTQARLVRAVLLRSWRAILVMENGEWRSPTKGEAIQVLYGGRDKKRQRIKTMEVCQLCDKEIADWLKREYRLKKVTEDSVKAARQSLSFINKNEKRDRPTKGKK